MPLDAYRSKRCGTAARGPLWLAPLSLLYGALMAFRSVLYRIGSAASRQGRRARGGGRQSHRGRHRQDAAGGLAGDATLRPCGMRVAIVSRGYGGRARGVTRVTVHSRAVGSRRRAAAAGAARAGDGVHRARPGGGGESRGGRWRRHRDHATTGCSTCALVRDCEIVVIDGQRGFGNGCLLPRGPLRE